jgi:PelA/Pel-15E family pectate lyase
VRRSFLFAVCALCMSSAAQAQEFSDAQALTALRTATAFFRGQVSVQGGYLWRYSADLSKREAEGKATATQAWVQPPGTPSVGAAFLRAHEATGDSLFLDAARETAMALVRGQLQSGGWDYRIEFDPEKRKGYAFRVDGNMSGNNVSTLDDGTTQSALSYLIRVDSALRFSDAAIHEAIEYALNKLLEVQYPNGAWPQRFVRAPNPAQFPVIKADYPESWSREYAQRDYRHDYTFNDNVISDSIKTLLLAFEIYGDTRYRDSAVRAGDFILLAQMPDPQPGWAQQYDANMHPVWARKFEPPAITGGESEGIMRTLIFLYRETGEPRFLEPLPRALAYYRKSLLPDGKLARFYELRTNRPLYFTKEYALTYEPDDLPTHYGFIVGSALDAIEREYEAAQTAGPKSERSHSVPTPDVTPEQRARAKAVAESLDERGAWVERGRLSYQGDDDPTAEIISCASFARNVSILADFIEATRNKQQTQRPQQGE